MNTTSYNTKTLGSFIDDNLKYYLWSTSIVDIDTKEIKDINKTRLRVFINDGILEIYSRFPLAYLNTLVVKVKDEMSYYPLDRDNPSIVSGYNGKILRVIKILDDYGRELPLNQENNPEAINVVNTSNLLVPFPERFKYLTIIYQGYPEYDIYGNDDDKVINLPVLALEALRYYVLSKVQSVGSITEQQEAMMNNQLFEQKLMLLEQDSAIKQQEEDFNLIPSIYGFI